MRTELAVITTEFFRDLVGEAISELLDEIDISVYYYVDFSDILNIYRLIPQRIRGVILSGPTPEYIIRSAYPDDGRVIRAFINDTAALYKNFLNAFHDYPGLTTDRIFFDTFHLIGLDLDEYLYGEKVVSWEEQSQSYYKNMSTEEIIASEKAVYQMHLKLWRANRFDVSFTRFSSLMDPLRRVGVNVRFMYPSKDYIQTICREAESQVQIIQLREKQPGVLLVTADRYHRGIKNVMQESMNLLKKNLLHFIKRYDTEAIITPAAFGFEVISTRQAVEKSTSGLQQCEMQGYLRNKLDFPVCIGYGLGLTLAQARLNAVDANREALQHSGYSFLINDQDELVGPLQTGAPLVVSRKVPPLVLEMSSKAGLSSLTVQRVLSVMEHAEDGYITSQMLAQHLSITQRSANRFLQALLANGQAEIIGMRRATTKGRPERLYHLLIDKVEKTV